MILSDILKDSNYKLTQFSPEQIIQLEERITVKDSRGKDAAYVTCLVRKKEMKLTPEEAIRQLYVLVLRDDFGYSTVEYDSEHYLLQNVKDRIDKKEYPIFVTAGNGTEKLTHIMHNKYLSYCYEQLCNIQGSLITFGFNFGDYDTHIIGAINIASKMGRKIPDKLWSVYIGVFSDDDLKHILEIKDKFKCKIVPYNARTANIWNN